MNPVLWLVPAAAVVGWSVHAYNRMVGLGKRAQAAWADIDAQLKRRHDLVPALVETVKGYAGHEQRTLDEVIRLRATAVRAREQVQPEGGVAASEGQLVGALRGLFALAESYPELKASERFGQLIEQLTEIEDRLQDARRYYNAVVRDLNTNLARFPDLLVARLAGFAPRQFFKLDNALERRAVEVDWNA